MGTEWWAHASCGRGGHLAHGVDIVGVSLRVTVGLVGTVGQRKILPWITLYPSRGVELTIRPTS